MGTPQDLCASGHGDLQKHHLADELGVRSEHCLEREQFLWDALDVIDTIHSEKHAHAFKLGLPFKPTQANSSRPKPTNQSKESSKDAMAQKTQ